MTIKFLGDILRLIPFKEFFQCLTNIFQQIENKENCSYADVYRCLETNERVMFRQEQKISRLTAQLNRVRLARTPSASSSPVKKSTNREDENFEKTFIKSTQSPMRPDHIDKLKKQLSGRKTIPVRSSPKVQTDLTTILTNRKPAAVEEATQVENNNLWLLKYKIY